MKTLGKRMIQHKINSKVLKQLEDDVNKQLNKERERIAYEALAAAMPDTVRQVEAMMLYALSKHGYGAKRLNDFHQWFCEISRLPSNIMGKSIDTRDVINYVRNKYGINFDETNIPFPTFEQYMNQDTSEDELTAAKEGV